MTYPKQDWLQYQIDLLKKKIGNGGNNNKSEIELVLNIDDTNKSDYINVSGNDIRIDLLDLLEENNLYFVTIYTDIGILKCTFEFMSKDALSNVGIQIGTHIIDLGSSYGFGQMFLQDKTLYFRLFGMYDSMDSTTSNTVVNMLYSYITNITLHRISLNILTDDSTTSVLGKAILGKMILV